MRVVSFCLVLITAVIVCSCSTQQLSPEEADRSMKLLNGNLVNLLSTGQEKTEFKALKFLLNQPGAPLPFVTRENATAPDTAVYRFNKLKGVYLWNKETKVFERIDHSETVTVWFPGEKSDTNDLSLELTGFQSQPYSSRPDFPTQLEAQIKDADRQLLTIHHSANMSDDMPEVISSEVTGNDYEIKFGLNRTTTGKNGELKISSSLKTKGFEVIAGNMEARIEYSRLGYFFKVIQFQLKLIDHVVEGNINYSAIDPTSADYISSFNSNSSIWVFEGRHKVGQIVLNKTNNGELLDYFIRFSDGKEVLLSEYIPALNKLLNLKY